MTIKSIFLSAALSVAFVGTASANLVTNGSFEDTEFSGKWQVFNTIDGWATGSGTGIEIQKSGTVVTAQDGNQYVELDSHDKGVTTDTETNSVMVQTVEDLEVGASYELSFWYQARTNTVGDNGIEIYWGSDLVDSLSETRDSLDGWTNYTYTVVADNESMDLAFGAFGKENTLGGFIDNVSLTLASVPEPATFALLGLGIFGLAAARKARS